MGTNPHYLPDIIVFFICAGFTFLAWRLTSDITSVKRRSVVRLALLVSLVIIGAGCAFATVRISNLFPRLIVTWVRAGSLICAGFLMYGVTIGLMARSASRFMPGRRKVLKKAATAAMALPVVVGAAAFIKRNDLVLSEVDVRIPRLPESLRNLRIVVLSDIHLSPIVSERELARAVDLANATKADMAFVTGDYITSGGDPLDVCLRQLARLRADAGTFGCLGNHEVYAGAEGYTAAEGSRLGLDILRYKSRQLQFGDATLNLVGVDYQRKGRKYLQGTEDLLIPGAVNVLLSHNPDVFPIAAAKGFDLTVSGHTHGGQVNLEILHPTLNVARFATPYVHGLYEKDGRSIYVTRGIGTIGIPARLGALPEVALIRLCAI